MNSTNYSMQNKKHVYTEDMPWDIIGSYFEGQHLTRCVRHQLESYNHFVKNEIQKTIDMFNPVTIHSEHDYDNVNKKYTLEIIVTFSNFHIFRPQIHENNGATKIMFPHEARLRNFTYSSSMTVDLNIKIIRKYGTNLSQSETFYKTLHKIHIGKLPIMVKSDICVLKQYKHLDHKITGECYVDAGGYFIINGSEKIVIPQERAAENRIYCFNIKKNNNKWNWLAEVKSVPDDKCISPKQINIMITSRNNGFGHPIYIQIPRIKQPVPLFILFRALDIISDRDICELITLDINDEKMSKMIFGLKASIVEANKYITKSDALNYIVNLAMYTPINMEKEEGELKKREFTISVLEKDLFPHCKTPTQKKYFLGLMTNKLLSTSFGWLHPSDRDSYINKRIDLCGTTINNLFRNYFNKLVKDMQKQVVREINNGSWKSTENYLNIINHTNIYKIVKSTTIENGIKRALATGDFGIKNTRSSKVGVAQVLNRLTYVSSLSHARRINTPIDKSGKLIPPRKLHGTSWGYICPAETPEGAPVGVVKNLSYMAHITIRSNARPLYEVTEPFIRKIEDVPTIELFNKVKVIINGNWIGIAENPHDLYLYLKKKKQQGIINIYTSIVFDYNNKEIKICNDGGRPTRPLHRVVDNNLVITPEMALKIKNKQIKWSDLLVDHVVPDTILEYIDPEEQNCSMIAMTPNHLNKKDTFNYKYTHCEIHPSTIFGILASCIPFPEHNQAPRLTYQCAMGKQAMGMYVTNFKSRMDKTAYILTYPMRPLVDTRLMNFIKLDKIPSGQVVMVAICTYSGYNQEDSIIFNQGSIDRGMFSASIFHTEKDEDKKIHGDEEIRCRPDKNKTKGMKFGNYDKLNAQGVMPENTLIESKDIILGKVIPIKENRNNPTKIIKYQDQSKSYQTNEECYVDKNYINCNGDGYTFAKVRIRAYRKPIIGDKFCYTEDHELLTENGWKPITEIGLGENIAILDNGNLSYEPTLDIHKYAIKDEPLYEVITQQFSLKTTLNHKMYVKKSDAEKYELIEAQHMMGKRVKFLKNCEGLVHFKLPPCPVPIENIEAWLFFFGFWVGDGWTEDCHTTCKKRKKHTYRTTICQVKPHSRQRILDAATKCGLHPIENGDKIHFYHKPLTDMLVPLSKGASKKCLPQWCFELSKDHSMYLLNGLIDSDGSINKSGAWSYSTSSLQLKDDVQRLVLHAGWSANVSIYQKAGYECVIKGRKIISKYDQWQVRINRSKNAPQLNHGHSKSQNGQTERIVQESGFVYCVTVRTGIVYVRRHGKTVWCGNSSRHGQKGTIGMVLPEKDMPFDENGLKPDIIINPHAIPSRMTMGQLKETLLGSVLCELGLFGDGTSFNNFPVKDICKLMTKHGYESNGNKILNNGMTGEQLETSVFYGPTFYQRLKHMVKDKQHSRGHGPMVVLTRQPAEGRAREGGLRFGEMERDCMVSHGAARFTKGRIYDCSDKFKTYACKKCGMFAIYNNEKGIHLCRICDNRTDFTELNIPYACKLLFQELITMNIAPRLITD